MATGTISSFVKSYGDTMNGSLLIDNASAEVKSQNITQGTTPASNIIGQGVRLREKNGVEMGFFRLVSMANGRQGIQVGAQRTVNGTLLDNGITLSILNDGTKVVNVSDQAVWRNAIGVDPSNYEAGDEIDLGSSLGYILNGVVLNNNTIVCDLYMPKNMPANLTLTHTLVCNWVRGKGQSGVVSGSISSVQKNGHQLRIVIAVTGATQFEVYSAQITGKVTFS